MSLLYRSISHFRIPEIVHSTLLPRSLTIVMYHGVAASEMPVPDWCFIDRELFRTQMEYLRRHFRILPLSTAIDRLEAGTIEEPTIAVTFDDGYQNNYDVA